VIDSIVPFLQLSRIDKYTDEEVSHAHYALMRKVSNSGSCKVESLAATMISSGH